MDASMMALYVSKSTACLGNERGEDFRIRLRERWCAFRYFLALRHTVAYPDGCVVCAVLHRACEDVLLGVGHLGIELGVYR